MSSTSYNQNSSQSTSKSFPVETPENSIMDQIAGLATGYAGDLYNWAGNVFNNTSQVTNQAVGNFFNTSQQMNGLSKNLTDQYNNLFAPENAQLVADANSYASPARMQADMGMAGATQAQAGNDALANNEEKLRSFGINPADGRYAALDQASRVQNAANVAGAENQQRVADIAMGQKLRSEAVQVGAQLPQAIANVNNTAIQANTGASNASLANANTGANLYSVPDKYLSTGMQVKLPFNGNQSQSSSQGTGNSQSQQPQRSSSDGGGSSNPYGGSYSSPSGSSSDYTGMDPNLYGGAPDMQSYNGGSQPDPLIQDVTPQTDWSTDTGGGLGGGADFSTPSTDYGGGWGDGSGDPGVTAMARGGAVPDDDNFHTRMLRSPYQHFEAGGRVGDNHAPSGPPATSYGGAGGRAGDAGFTQGGHVPKSASPSNGAVTDDVPAQTPGGHPARLNADEFVIPQDVALWKGQEFFQNLIDQSRKKRVMGSAKPTQMKQGQ